MALDGFGNRLKEFRKERGFTQKHLANLLGVTEQAVSKWECETSYPDIMMLNGISEVLGCSLDYLFQFEADRKNRLNQDCVERKEEITRNLLPDIIALTFGEKLVPAFVEESRQGFPHICSLRCQMASQWGVMIPAIRVMDECSLEPEEYQICVQGVPVYKGRLENVDDEAFQLIFSKLGERILANIHRIINNQTVYFMVENLKRKYPYVAEGIVPEQISYSRLRQVLIHLIRDYQYAANALILIIESMENHRDIPVARELAEMVAKDIGEGYKRKMPDSQ